MESKTSIVKITFQGFKSFNKKISIPLLPGFNVIAGPNGSGKSNIIDAIIFVIGKKSAKSLRADRLHELIFHNNDNKIKNEYASVTLFLDNKNKIFPFDENEISIMRKINKKGVSTYKINGKTTTREKILQILGSVKIKPNGHNIVMQGDITSIIEMNPKERRYVLDEISGISEYNDKKEQAKKDLDFVDQKIKEAEIIITQRYELFKKLESEKNSAIKYREFNKKLTILKGSYAKKRLDNFEEDMLEIKSKIILANEENENVTKEISETEKELDEREESIRKIANKVHNISKTFQIEKEVSELRVKIMITKDKINSNKIQIERLENLIERLNIIETKKEEFIGNIPKAVKIINKMNIDGVHGIISDLIQIPNEYKTSIDIAAGHHIYDIIVENENVAKICIDYLKRERIGRATFLPLNKIKPNFLKYDNFLNNKDVYGIASDLIKFDEKYLKPIKFVFGSTVIINNLNTAKNIGIGKLRMVTLDGTLIERSGAMVGGFKNKMNVKLSEDYNNKEIEKYKNSKINLENENNKLTEDLKDIEEKFSKYEISETEKEFINLETKNDISEEEIIKLRSKRRLLHNKKIQTEIKYNNISVQKARLEAEVGMLKPEVDKYGPNIEYINDKLSSLQNQINKIEKEINLIGPVNMKSIDDYEKIKTEFDTYKEKYEKIIEEKKSVIEMIEEIEEKRKETFSKTLNIVGKEFNDIFTKMAKGKSEIILENSEDIESGLLIKASPRGKILLNIDSMSGGEKTLTAMAFILAIQRYSPSVFYVFDEIDAALDKENSKEIAKMLKIESEKSQFIMITHNDETIKMGDRIYGVTMENGETKVLGLELPDN